MICPEQVQVTAPHIQRPLKFAIAPLSQTKDDVMSVTSHFTIADRRALVEHLGRHTIKARNQIGGSGAHLATNAIEFAAKYRKAKLLIRSFLLHR
jgi:hypothetical protein